MNSQDTKKVLLMAGAALVGLLWAGFLLFSRGVIDLPSLLVAAEAPLLWVGVGIWAVSPKGDA